MSSIKVGEERNGYVVEEKLSVGAFALAYKASKGGRDVFLKQYKSPKPSVAWYSAYVEYQSELKKRIESSSLRGFTYEFIEFFEATRPPRHSPHSKQYYQVFEWISEGTDLAGIIETFRANPGAYTWEQRLTWAKVIMGSIHQLHQQKIIHTDLKPENLILIPDDSIAVGYRLKLIDLDFAVLADRMAPFGREIGYVGTPGWYSPEHFNSQIPDALSDVFTCGLILYAVLGKGNPYEGLDEAAYLEQAKAYAAEPPVLEGPMPGGNDAAVVKVLHQCLSPFRLSRPTALEVNQALIGPPGRGRSPRRGPRLTAPLPVVAAKPAPAPADPRPPTPEPVTPTAPTAPTASTKTAGPSLVLTSATDSMTFNISTRLSKYSVRALGDDALFWDNDWQMTVEKRADGWYVVPNTSATNETILDGRAVTVPSRLEPGQELGVGRESKGIVKLPMAIGLVTS